MTRYKISSLSQNYPEPAKLMNWVTITKNKLNYFKRTQDLFLLNYKSDYTDTIQGLENVCNILNKVQL